MHLLRRAAVAAVVVGAAVVPGTAQATTTCSTTLSGTINGSLVVPVGATCTLDGATVNGRVSVSGGPTTQLMTVNGTRMVSLTAIGSGSVTINDSKITGATLLRSIGTGDNENPGNVAICGSTIGGSLGVIGTTANIYIGDEERNNPSEACFGGPTTIKGSVSFTGNATTQLQLAGSHVGGSVTAVNNSPMGGLNPEGEEDFASNTVTGSFICRGNTTNDIPGDDFDIFGTVAASLDCRAPVNQF